MNINGAAWLVDKCSGFPFSFNHNTVQLTSDFEVQPCYVWGRLD